MAGKYERPRQKKGSGIVMHKVLIFVGDLVFHLFFDEINIIVPFLFGYLGDHLGAGSLLHHLFHIGFFGDIRSAQQIGGIAQAVGPIQTDRCIGRGENFDKIPRVLFKRYMKTVDGGVHHPAGQPVAVGQIKGDTGVCLAMDHMDADFLTGANMIFRLRRDHRLKILQISRGHP